MPRLKGRKGGRGNASKETGNVWKKEYEETHRCVARQ